MHVLENELCSSWGKGNLSNEASISLMRSKSELLSDSGFLKASQSGDGGCICRPVALLFPDVPASPNEHSRQAPFQGICPDISVEVNAKDQCGFVDEMV